MLLKRPIPVVRNFTANLLSYAMGRRVEYYDQSAIRVISWEAEANDYRMSSFIMGGRAERPISDGASSTGVRLRAPAR